MASSWGDVVSEQADLISTRLRQLVSSGLNFLHDELGIDLGLKPERYPAWVFLSTALIGLFLLLVLVAACSGGRRRKQGAARCKSTAALSANDSVKAPPVKAPKPEEPKKKNKKKAAEKKNQSNGGTAPEPREQVKVVKEFPKQAAPAPKAAPAPAPKAAPAPAPKEAAPAPAPKAAAPAPAPKAAAPAPAPKAAAPAPKAAAPAPAPKAAAPAPKAAAPPPPQPQPPVDAKAEKAKKSKKKPKPEVKPTQAVSSTDGKEPDEGAWETKISNREKRQQRKKDKGSNDESGSPGGGRHLGQQTEQPAVTAPAPANSKKNKETLNLKAAKGDASVTPVLSTWNNVSSVSSGGWTDMSVKLSQQVSASDREKSSVGIKTSGHRTSEPLAWAQESEGSCPPSMDGRIKPEVNRVNFRLRLNPSVTQSAGDAGSGLPVADEWSGFNGLGAVDPSSDWNAPTEMWGNYDEPKAETPAAQETPISQLQESDDDDKDKGDPSGSGKSKRKKKKKKKPEDENAGSQVTTEGSTAPAESGFVKPRPHVPVEEATKQIITPQSGQKKTDQNLEPLKQVQKKKARRET